MSRHTPSRRFVAAALALSSAALIPIAARAQAQPPSPTAAAAAPAVVADAWVRGTVAQQKATGMFARITAPQAARLVDAKSPLAATVEIHEMRMDGDTMRMRAIPALDLPAGQAVDLKPGGYHVMLMGLTQPLSAGQMVPVTLVFEVGSQRRSMDLQVPVRALSDGGHGGHGGAHGAPKAQ